MEAIGGVKIAQISPLIESVPPSLYGGTERIVSYLTEALVKLGHDVELFASGDSKTSAKLAATTPRALRLADIDDPLPFAVLQLEKVRQRAHEFDILHFHTDYLHFPLDRYFGRPTVTTMHGRLDLPGYGPLFSEFMDTPLVSISDDQRRPLPARWVATIYHGLPKNLFRPGDGSGGYLAYLGRMSPEKRPDRAIEIARRAGVELRMAAKVNRVEQRYFDDVVRPLLAGPGVEYLGEINEAEKQRFLGDARALLFPIDWPEPFGLVMIEAMACGTPVIGWRCGSVPEVVDEDVTGIIVDSDDEAVEAVKRIASLDRKAVRERFNQRFTAERMALEYLRVYEALTGWEAPALPTADPQRGNADCAERAERPARPEPPTRDRRSGHER